MPRKKKTTTVTKKAVPKRTKQDDSKQAVTEQVGQKKQRAPRRPVTLESHLEKYDNLLKILDGEIERKQKEKEKGTRVFRSIRKLTRELRNEASKISKTKRRVSSDGKKVSGFVLKCKISDKLADFMGLDHGSTPSRNEITNSICVYANLKDGENRPQMLKWKHLNPGGKRNLQDPDDKMVIKPDAKLSKLLNYAQYKKDVKAGKVTKTVTVTDKNKNKKRQTVVVKTPEMRYWVIQRLIQSQIHGTIREEKKKLEEASSSVSSSDEDEE